MARTIFSDANLTQSNFLWANVLPEQLLQAKKTKWLLLPNKLIIDKYTIFNINEDFSGTHSSHPSMRTPFIKVFCGCKEQIYSMDISNDGEPIEDGFWNLSLNM